MRTTYLLAVAFLFGVAGCKTTHPAQQQTTQTSIIDSTGLNVVERLVEVVVPGDTVWYEHWVECPESPLIPEREAIPLSGIKGFPKPFKAQMKGRRSDGIIELNSAGKLMAIFNCNQWRDSVKVRDREIAKLRHVSKTDSTVITVSVRYVPQVYKASMWFSCIVIALLVLWFGIKAAKIYFKLNIPFL